MELNIEWVKSQRGHSTSVEPNGVRITHTQKDKARAQTSIRLGVDVMKKCGFFVGDKVCIGFSDVRGARAMIIKRVNDGSGFKLSNSRRKEFVGTNKSWGVAKVSKIEIKSGCVDLHNCSIHDDMLIVPLDHLQ